MPLLGCKQATSERRKTRVRRSVAYETGIHWLERRAQALTWSVRSTAAQAMLCVQCNDERVTAMSIISRFYRQATLLITATLLVVAYLLGTFVVVSGSSTPAAAKAKKASPSKQKNNGGGSRRGRRGGGGGLGIGLGDGFNIYIGR